MAIDKSEEDEHGYTAAYWYLTGFWSDRATLTATGIFRSFESQAARIAGKRPIGRKKAEVAITGASSIGDIVSALETEVLATTLSGGSGIAD